MIEMKSYAGTAQTLADNVNKSENALLAAMEKTGDAKNEGEIERLRISYQKDQRSLALFSEMMKNMHDMLMSLIRSLKLN